MIALTLLLLYILFNPMEPQDLDPIPGLDAIYEKIRDDGRVISEAVFIIF
jgi:hypothetical protein